MHVTSSGKIAEWVGEQKIMALLIRGPEWWAFKTIDCDVHEIILSEESDEFELGQYNFLLDSLGIQSFFIFIFLCFCFFFFSFAFAIIIIYLSSWLGFFLLSPIPCVSVPSGAKWSEVQHNLISFLFLFGLVLFYFILFLWLFSGSIDCVLL